MRNRIVFISVLIFLFSSAGLSAQISYGVKLKGGASSIYMVDGDKDDHLSGYDNFYKPISLFGIEAMIHERIVKSRFSFEQGISLESSGAEVWLSLEDYESFILLGYDVNRSWSFRTYQIGIPFKIEYDLKNWFTFYGGVNNIFYLKGGDVFINKNYALRGDAGFDFNISSKYRIGLEGSYDITPSGQFENYSIYTHCYHVAISVDVMLGQLSFKRN
jgi:hypothetical protein